MQTDAAIPWEGERESIDDETALVGAAQQEAACNTTAQAFADALQVGKTSMLAICQETSPTMTADRLVAALIVPFKSKLDEQVASGAITASEEAADLANIRIKLIHMVPDQPGTAPGSKKP